jgi:putative hemolysin
MNVLAIVLMVGIFLLISGFASGYETGLISIPVSVVEEKRFLKKKSDLWLIDKMRDLEKLVAATLVVTNFASSASTIIFLSLAIRFLSETKAEIATIILIMPLCIVFAEVVPKSIFRAKPSLIFKTAKLFQLLYYFSISFAYIFYLLPSKLIDKFSKTSVRVRALDSREQIKAAIVESEEKGLLQEHERTILHKVFHLGEEHVKEIMIPNKRVVSVSSELDMKDIIGEFKKHEFVRLPVYDKNREEYIGVINYMDLLIQEIESGVNLERLLHDISYFDDNTYLDDLLVQMLRNNIHMAGIRNSLNEAVGIVTLEDVMEEIVGEY